MRTTPLQSARINRQAKDIREDRDRLRLPLRDRAGHGSGADPTLQLQTVSTRPYPHHFGPPPQSCSLSPFPKLPPGGTHPVDLSPGPRVQLTAVHWPLTEEHYGESLFRTAIRIRNKTGITLAVLLSERAMINGMPVEVIR